MPTGLDHAVKATSPPQPETGGAGQDRGLPINGGPSHDRPVRATQPSIQPTSSRSSAPAPDSRTANWSNDPGDRPDHESAGHAHAAWHVDPQVLTIPLPPQLEALMLRYESPIDSVPWHGNRVNPRKCTLHEESRRSWPWSGKNEILQLAGRLRAQNDAFTVSMNRE
jgi:hypothetical protein